SNGKVALTIWIVLDKARGNGNHADLQPRTPEINKTHVVKIRARRSTTGKIVLDPDRWNLLHTILSNDPQKGEQEENGRYDEGEGPAQQPTEPEDLDEEIRHGNDE